MYRASTLIGKTVICGTSGAKLGRIADLVFTDDFLMAFVVRSSWFGRERIFRRGDATLFNKDRIVVRTERDLRGLQQWRESGIRRWSDLKSKRVITREGCKIGIIDDVYLDEHRGAIDGYDVAEPAFGGLRVRHSALAPSDDLLMTADAVTISGRVAFEEDGRMATPHGNDFV